MTITDAGSNASASTNPSVKPPISPAARKFAEYLAQRMRPMIENAAKRREPSAAPAVTTEPQRPSDKSHSQ
jgi:hypothetical protein